MIRRRAVAIAIALVTACGAPARAPETSSAAPTDTAAAPSPSASEAPTTRLLQKGRLEQGSFRSTVLARTMPFAVYLPPGYDAKGGLRYAAAYLLHGGSGTNGEWVDYGLLDAADRLISDATIPPLIIVLPQGDQEYWVDHVVDRATGANGEKWGTYVAREVVPEIDRRYRTIAKPDARSIGGLSMGGHGAMQLSLNFPGIWSVIGAHSPALRPFGDAPTYLGMGAEFAARDPLSLIKAKPDLARTYTWWIDLGDADPWRVPATAIHDQLTALGIGHEWHAFTGGHDLAYWSSHMDDYLRYYAGALCRERAKCPPSP